MNSRTKIKRTKEQRASPGAAVVVVVVVGSSAATVVAESSAGASVAEASPGVQVNIYALKYMTIIFDNLGSGLFCAQTRIRSSRLT